MLLRRCAGTCSTPLGFRAQRLIEFRYSTPTKDRGLSVYVALEGGSCCIKADMDSSCLH